MSAGAIALACDAVDGRSRLRSVRYSGLSRVSRGFAQTGGAVRVVASTLGPGILGGDRYTCDGLVCAGASFELRGQMATPVLAGERASETHAHWSVAANAVLVIVGEPLMLAPNARHAAVTDIDVDPRSITIASDIVRCAHGARFSTRTSVRIAGRLAVCDALHLTGNGDDTAFGTLIVVCDDDERRARLHHAWTHEAGRHDVRVGFGETVTATVLRCSSASVWSVARTIAACADRAREAVSRPRAARS